MLLKVAGKYHLLRPSFELWDEGLSHFFGFFQRHALHLGHHPGDFIDHLFHCNIVLGKPSILKTIAAIFVILTIISIFAKLLWLCHRHPAALAKWTLRLSLFHILTPYLYLDILLVSIKIALIIVF